MINDIIQLLGIANPQLSVQWTNNAATVLNYDGSFTLTCPNNDSFVAPVAGVLNVNRGLEKIMLPTGVPPAQGAVLKLDPQAYLRLRRLYGDGIEQKQAANNANSVVERPVPLYFVYTNITGTNWTDSEGNAQNSPLGGLYLAGADLHLYGNLTIHDEHGFPIDPIAVAAAYNSFVRRFATLERKALNSNPANPAPPFTANSQINALVNANGNNQTRIQLLTPNGAIYNPPGLPVSNVVAVNAAQGLYTVTNPANPIGFNAGSAADLRIGPATNGVLGANYTITAAVAGLARDFVRAYVVELNKFLLGSAPANEPSIQYNTATNNLAPMVRDNELVTFCVNGNQCLGVVNAITAGAPPLSLLVSPVLDNDFTLPPAPAGNGNESWPQFPAGGAAPPFQAIPGNLNIQVAANFVQDANTSNADVQVVLTSNGFVAGDSVRIYPRVFHDDGTETRGDGAGAIIAGNAATFRLKDPFDLVKPFQPVVIPNSPLLMFDAVVVNRGFFKRTFGNLQSVVGAAQPAAPPAVNNNFAALPERGISTGGIQGIVTNVPAGGAVNFGNFLLNVLGENQPRASSRYPTMGRYDSMAASFNAGNWQAFCGGSVFQRDALNNFPFLANPGNPGGREYSSAGVQTNNGLLAYDLARAAYRRTRNVLERMGSFLTGANAANWQPPAAPAAGANNTFAGAVLQTVAHHCETPEIGLAYSDMTNVPNSVALFIQQVQNALLPGGALPPWVPAALQARFNNFIAGLGTDPQNQQAYNEVYREFVTSLYGRRDTFWALKDAIANAREFIYIQSTFFGHTAYPGPNWPGTDFVEMLKNAVIANPRLKVILCLGRPIRYGKGYEVFEARDYKHRKEAVEYLQGPLDPNTKKPVRAGQVLAFHPNGFPMRPKELRHQVVVVDDMWALAGSSSFRRRGLQFDGSQDVVLTDKRIVNGKSAGIKNFRIALMREHLNLQNVAGLAPGLLVRLNDTHETFYALKELLDSGGAGLIRGIWEGDRLDITEPSFPSDDLADPDNTTFDEGNAALIAAIGALSTTPA